MTEAVAGVYEGEGKFVFEKPVLFAKGQKVIVNFKENEPDDYKKKEKFFSLAGKIRVDEKAINNLRTESIL